MIEVEKKFTLNKKDIERLTEHAEFLIQRVFIDIYYDTNKYTLTRKDWWLRSRDGEFELKIPMAYGARERLTDQYQEINNTKEIASELNIKLEDGFGDALAANGYSPFASITTNRRKYKKEGFTIDLDTVDFGYELGEIELLVQNRSEIARAEMEILDFAKRNGLAIAPTRGKVREYLRRTSPVHYRALIDAGVIRD